MAMHDDQLANRYAGALIETLAEMGGKENVDRAEKVLEDMMKLVDGDTGIFFGSPVFSRAEKKEVVDTILKQSKHDPWVARFLNLLIDEGHIHLLRDIKGEFSKEKRARRHEALAKIRTAFPLSENILKRLSSALETATQKKVLVDVEVDKDLIGGVIAEIGSTRYDASVQGYLSRLQEEF